MQHYSTIKQIDTYSVKQLGQAWYADVSTRDGLARNPLVADGGAYQSGAMGKMWAHDVQAGTQLWELDAQIFFAPEYSPVAYWGSRVS